MDETDPVSFNLRLIEAVRSNHCLYDSKDRLYRSTEYKIRIWNRLVRTLNFSGDARLLYCRWKQLRDKYGKEKRKIKFSGTDSKPWQYFKHLTFLDPHMTDRNGRDAQGMCSPGGTPYQVPISDPNFMLNLIQEVQQHPCLYDIRDPKYRLSECRNEAWTEIIKTLNFPGDITSMYKQWKKVRDRYVREKRKIRTASIHESNGEKSNWELYSQMVWIDPFLDDRASYYSRHLKRKRIFDDMLSDDDYMDDIIVGQTSNSSLLSPYSSFLLHGDEQDKSHLINQDNHDAISRSLIDDDSLPLQSHHMHAIDGDKAFALSVAADIQALPEPARAIAKEQIQNWLDNSSFFTQLEADLK